MKINKEALELLAQHYKSYDMLLAEHTVGNNLTGQLKYTNLIRDVAIEYGRMAELETFGDVHRAIYLPN